MIEPEITFHFGESEMCFRHPVRTLVAWDWREVLSTLRGVEAGVAAGLHAAGFLSYEAAPAFDRAMETAAPGPLPLAWFGLFEAPVQPDPEHPDETFHISRWNASISEREYEKAIARVHEAIAAGETYQVNYTFRLRAGFQGSDAALYHRLRRAQGPGYHSRLNLGRYRILSASPEMFFRWEAGRLTTKPMKGTMRRGRWVREDGRLAEALLRSAKDRAENVMVVDMMRSDMGRIAIPGTVRAAGLFDVETYPTLHQMTSTLHAETLPGARLTDVFTALFPSASITGAPKVNTMRWIRDLETEPRGVYCGAIGYVRPGGEAVFSVPIRTLTLDTGTGIAEYGVGGGVTWDSTREGEYREAWLKAKVLTRDEPVFDLLETILLVNGRYHLMARHLARLAASARYFAFPEVRPGARRALQEFAEAHAAGAWRVRLTVSPEGVARVEGAPISPSPSPLLFALARTPVDPDDVFLFHKTTHRAAYESRRAARSGVRDVLLWNTRGEITEFTTGNVALEFEGRRYTPPVESGLLGGTFRGYLLDCGELTERVLMLQDLWDADRVWFLNSVRGWVEMRAAARDAAEAEGKADAGVPRSGACKS